MFDKKAIGQDLISASAGSAIKRSNKTYEMFPYIFVASSNGKSVRFISNWLSERDVKISASTIAKALREQDDYFKSYYERFRGLELELNGLTPLTREGPQNTRLFDEKLFLDVFENPNSHHLNFVQEYSRLSKLVKIIKDEWFDLPVEFREACKENVEGETNEADEH